MRGTEWWALIQKISESFLLLVVRDPKSCNAISVNDMVENKRDNTFGNAIERHLRQAYLLLPRDPVTGTLGSPGFQRFFLASGLR